MTTFIIPSSVSDLHTLDIKRIDNLLYITTNNRKMYEKWGTLAWDETMVRQLIQGLEAVLAGAHRAATQLQLDLEEAEAVARTRARERNMVPANTALDYDNLFGEQ